MDRDPSSRYYLPGQESLELTKAGSLLPEWDCLRGEFPPATSIAKTKVLDFKGSENLRSKITIENNVLEQVNNFNYLGCNISYIKNEDISSKIKNFNYLCGTIKITFSTRILKCVRLVLKISIEMKSISIQIFTLAC